MGNLERIKQHLLKLEKLLLQPKIRHSSDELSKLLADEFIEFGSSGKIWTKSQIIDALLHEKTIEMSIREFQIKELTKNVILVTYQIFILDENNTSGPSSLRSSIWKKIEERWMMYFHQGTPIKK